MTFSIAQKFTTTPGLRYRWQGPFSGEQFREEYLDKLYKEFVATGIPVEIDLDGVFGYPTSFLEEAFGGLARIYSPSKVLKAFSFSSDEWPSTIEEIIEDIENANAQ